MESQTYVTKKTFWNLDNGSERARAPASPGIIPCDENRNITCLMCFPACVESIDTLIEMKWSSYRWQRTRGCSEAMMPRVLHSAEASWVFLTSPFSASHFTCSTHSLTPTQPCHCVSMGGSAKLKWCRQIWYLFDPHPLFTVLFTPTYSTIITFG